MKRAVQVVTLIAIALWLACFASVQFAVWAPAQSVQWRAEAIAFGSFAVVLSIIAAIGWGVLPPPEPPEG